MESKFIPVRGNPSSPTKNTDCPSGRSVFFFARRRYPACFAGQLFNQLRRMHIAPGKPPNKIANPPPVRSADGFFVRLRSRLHLGAQPLRQLPPRQAAHERVKAIGAHRQPAVRARPQVRIFPRRQRRKTHLASPHPHSSLPAAKLLCIWITFALSLYSLEEFVKHFFCACIKMAVANCWLLHGNVVFLTKTVQFKAPFLTFCTKKLRNYMENGYCNPSPFALP